MRPLLRWVVGEGTSGSLGELVLRFGAAADGALSEGRLFVDGRRETAPDTVVQAPNVVEVYARRDVADAVEILAEHHGLVFASKPLGVATEPDHAGIEASLVARVAALIGTPRETLHAVSRLDVGVSGVVTLARDATARQLATELRAEGRFARRYLGLALGAPSPSEGVWSTPVDERAAETRYGVVASSAAAYLPTRAVPRQAVTPALLVLAPVTGRTHQLRIHAERAGVSLLGDTAHGGAARLLLPNGSVLAVPRVGLHAAWVELTLKDERLRVAAPLPPDLLALWQALGGAPDDWNRALEIALPPARG